MARSVVYFDWHAISARKLGKASRDSNVESEAKEGQMIQVRGDERLRLTIDEGKAHARQNGWIG